MPNYYITAVQHSNAPHRHISVVSLHEVDANNNLLRGRRTSRGEVVRLLQQVGNIVRTLRWDYAHAQWRFGATVDTERIGGEYYLRTDPNAVVADNLSHLPPLSAWL